MEDTNQSYSYSDLGLTIEPVEISCESIKESISYLSTDQKKELFNILINDKSIEDDFDFLKLIKENYQLFTVFGLFGAITIYLNTLMKGNSNAAFNNSSFNSTIYDVCYNSIIVLKNTILSKNTSYISNVFYEVAQSTQSAPVSEIILNIAVASSLLIFIILGISILKLYQKVESRSSNIFDMLLIPFFIILIITVIIYILSNFSSIPYLILIILLIISQVIMHFLSKNYQTFNWI